MTDTKIEFVPISELRPYEKNPRTHSSEQVRKLVASMQEFGWTVPVLVDGGGEVIAGHGRLMAAQVLGIEHVPVIRLEHLTPAQVRAYRIADNQLTLLGDWEEKFLAEELKELCDDEFDLNLLGFSSKELDNLLSLDDDDELIDDYEDIEPAKDPVTCLGDTWVLGNHKVMCASSAIRENYDLLLDGKRVAVCLTDPPYGLGDSTTKKNNYASYEDSSDSLDRLITAFFPIVSSLSDICIITPGNGNVHRYTPPTWTMAWFTPAGVGRGPWGFCCWQPIICYGKDPKLTKRLGCHPDAFTMTEAAYKSEHPCAKPIGVWSWLMKRVSERDETVLDPFLGSGTSVIVAEKLGRRCFALEIEPGYVDICVRRWEELTGKNAILKENGQTFAEIKAERKEKGK